jgi:SAM-dependent methyltransferase
MDRDQRSDYRLAEPPANLRLGATCGDDSGMGTVRSHEFWEHQSSLPGLRSVIDPNDRRGWKSAYLDRLHKAALARHLDFQRRDRVLDFGCGIGRITRWVAPRVATVHGIDGYRTMLERARSELVAARVRNVLVCAYDGARLPFQTAAFDKTTCVWVLQHIVDEIELSLVLAELARVSRPGAVLAFIERVSEQGEESWMPPETIVRRPVEVYAAAFASAHLSVKAAEPICDDGPIWHNRRIDRLVLGGRLPTRLFAAIAHIDLAVRRRRTVGSWTDHLFVCERS